MAETKMVYTLDEVSEILHITKRTLYTHVKAGKLKAVKLGKFWRVTQANLDEYLSTGTKSPTAAYRIKPKREPEESEI